MQYITFSAKELLAQLNLRVQDLDTKLDGVILGLAKLDAVYVTREEWQTALREAALSRRFAIASIIGSAGALGTFIGILVNTL